MANSFKGGFLRDDVSGALVVVGNTPGGLFYAKDYGVRADGVTVADAAITSGQATLSSSAAGFTNADRNKLVVVLGAGAAGAHLYTTIVSVSVGVATLAATAGTTVSGAECFFATDDTTSAQACITAAAAVGSTAVFPDGDIGLSAALTTPSSSPVTILGQGAKELFGPGTSYNEAAMPTVSPYLQGTVFVPCVASINAFALAAKGVAQSVKQVGVRFAGKFRSTGHGVYSVPASNYGNIGGVFEDVRVFGHDGDHYAMVLESPELCRDVGCRAYGGGGIWFRCNAGTPFAPGNHTSVGWFSQTFLAGTAHGIHIDSTLGVAFDYCTWTNVEATVSFPTPAISGTSPPTSAQKCIETTNGAGMINMGFNGVAFESNVSSGARFPTGVGCYRTNEPLAGGGLLNTALTAAPASGTAYQNLTGKPTVAYHTFLMQPLAAASVSTTLSANSAYGAVSLTVTSSAGFSVGQGIQIDTGTNMEFAIVSAVPDGTHLTLLSPGNFGLEIAHLSGATVAVGAAVAYGQVSTTSSFPGLKLGWVAKPIGSGNDIRQIAIPIPSHYYERLDWAGCSWEWTQNLGSF